MMVRYESIEGLIKLPRSKLYEQVKDISKVIHIPLDEYVIARYNLSGDKKEFKNICELIQDINSSSYTVFGKLVNKTIHGEIANKFEEIFPEFITAYRDLIILCISLNDSMQIINKNWNGWFFPDVSIFKNISNKFTKTVEVKKIMEVEVDSYINTISRSKQDFLENLAYLSEKNLEKFL